MNVSRLALTLLWILLILPGCAKETAAPPSDAAHGHDHASEHAAGEISHYTCSMHPSVRASTPGKCPICGMDLVPVLRQEAASASVVVDEARRQSLGIRTAIVAKRAEERMLRAVGTVTFDESRLSEVTVKVPGYVERLYVERTGDRVAKGAVLLELYSPELVAAQQEYRLALASQGAARASTAPDRADYLVEAARARLKLWDLSEFELDALAAGGEPRRTVRVLAPASGYVVEKMIVEGAAVEPGMRLFRLAALDRVWVEAQVAESDLAAVSVGMPASIALPNQAGQRFEGRVSFVYPYLDGATRTGRVRIELANPRLELKPEMFANVELRMPGRDLVAVPTEAVLHTGERDFVFVDLGEGRLQPRRVELGATFGESVEVRSGLEEGETIVTSGNFLIAAESRLQQALEQWP